MMRGAVHGLIVVALLSCAGCTTWQRKGDVLVYISDGKPHGWPIPMMPAHRIKFPPIDIGTVGRTVVRVRDLPAPLLPSFAQLEVPDAEADFWRPGQPWRSAVFEISFVDTSGTLLHSRVIDLAELNWGSGPGRNGSHRNLTIPVARWSTYGFGPPPPHVLNYDLIVRVIRPSGRKSDQITLEESWPVGRYRLPQDAAAAQPR
jgi:hypothetical protein